MSEPVVDADPAAPPLPVVYYLPGMAGMLNRDRHFRAALRRVAGIAAVHERHWVRWPWALQVMNLRDREAHHRAADELAAELHREPADRPIVLMGHSTGAMIVLDAIERLIDRRVWQAWLLAAAVHRRYDLRRALPHVDQIINVHSHHDRFHLTVGTSLVGAADGRFGISAGYRGFIGPGSDDPCVIQHPYDPAWRSHGYTGSHLSILHADFARAVIGPAIAHRAAL